MRRILNNAISLIVVVIVLFLVIPLHPSVLDVLLILNISLSIMILMITMNISEPLEFSIFPSLLLITTLFRLGLNVSSTRLILKNGGNAGVVIKAFGDLITQGNIVIGILIFLIIVLVQFIVITKGAERVSEVAARFTLDAMPGKQMAIDADLSSGLINEKEARLRRQKIQREADFYGAMDGATKIVKGDAVMSLIITVINFVAGLIIGIVQGGGDLSTVLSVYSIATIGDGPGVSASGSDDLHCHWNDRDSLRIGREPEYRCDQPVQGPAQSYYGDRHDPSDAGAFSRDSDPAPSVGGSRPFRRRILERSQNGPCQTDGGSGERKGR